MADAGGVVMLPPPPNLREAVDADILQTAGQLQPGSRGGLVATVMMFNGKPCANLAVVHRSAGGHVAIGAYIGKAWSQPITGGGTVKLEW